MSKRPNPLQWLGLALIRFYQRFISPLFGPTCRYYPSCSSYAVEAIQLHGFFKGTGLGVWRILRCNPWSRGGVDFPPGSTREVPIPPDPIDDDEDVDGAADDCTHFAVDDETAHETPQSGLCHCSVADESPERK